MDFAVVLESLATITGVMSSFAMLGNNTCLECAFVDFESSNRWYVGRNIDAVKLKEQIDHIRRKALKITL